MTDDDCWDAFGSDSDDSDDDSDEIDNDNDNDDSSNHLEESSKAAPSIAMHLSQAFVKHNPQVRLSDRTVLVVRAKSNGNNNHNHNHNNHNHKHCPISNLLTQRGMRVLRAEQEPEHGCGRGLPLADAMVILPDDKDKDSDKDDDDDTVDQGTAERNHELVRSRLCPGGVLVFGRATQSGDSNSNSNNDNDNDNDNDDEDWLFARKSATGTTKKRTLLVLAKADNNATPVIHTTGNTRWIARRKCTIRAHASTCPWLSSSHSLAAEEERLHSATVALSSHEMAAPITSSGNGNGNGNNSNSNNNNNNNNNNTERSQALLTEHSLQKAVRSMRDHGYCILPGLLDAHECSDWGSAVLDSFHAAATILKRNERVDLYHPQNSEREPQSYRELSMREDLRLDLRQGPALDALRTQKEGSAERGGASVVVTASQTSLGDGLFLRGHPSLLEIVRRTMNPGSRNDHTMIRSNGGGGSSCGGGDTHRPPLYLGNLGRWNFGGTGNDGSYQNLRVSPVGGIVSLPGSAEQALHADTPHLFEHIPDLPAHYVNLFAPCTPFDDRVGGTAFVHGSHDLGFVADRLGNNTNSNASKTNEENANDNSVFYPWLVRPELTVGDVVLFDCRILHFGLANRSETIERCICYVNTWQDWFHDAKNWDQNRAIFETSSNDKDKDEEQQRA